MADTPTLQAATDEVVVGAHAGRKLPWLKIIIALVVLGAGGAGGWWYLTIHKAEPGAAKVKEAAPTGPPLYVPLDPPFVVNFEAERLVRFLQITMQIMSRDPATIELIKTNDPVIRNDLLLLFGNQQYANVATREGKERLRDEALKTIKRIVASSGGKAERVEAVYFTSFVMQ